MMCFLISNLLIQFSVFIYILLHLITLGKSFNLGRKMLTVGSVLLNNLLAVMTGSLNIGSKFFYTLGGHSYIT